MSKLRITNVEVGLAEIGLKPGVYTLGRDPANDFPINHPSVSGVHCRLVVGEDAVRVIDLGSTNGTFVDDRPVSEAMLTPAHVMRVGDVAMMYELEPGLRLARARGGDETTVASEPEPVPTGGRIVVPAVMSTPLELARKESSAEAPSTPPPLTPCARHPDVSAVFICTNCRTRFCADCVYHWPDAVRSYCPVCTGVVLTLADDAVRQERAQEKRRRDRRFFGNLGEVFRYPLRGDGYILLISGAVFYSFIQFILLLAWRVGPFGLGAIILLTWLGTGYLAAYFYKVIQATGQGEDALPDWPGFSSWWDDIAAPTLQLMGICLFCFGPAVAYPILFEYDRSLLVLWSLVGYGLLYFPMAMLAVVMFDTIAALNPLTVLSAIVKVPREYAVACTVFWGVALCWLLNDLVLSAVLPVLLSPLPGVTTFLTFLVSLYLMTVEACLLGRIYWTNAERLGWFKVKR